MSFRIGVIPTLCAILLCSAARVPDSPQAGHHLAIERRNASGPSTEDCRNRSSDYFLSTACNTKLNLQGYISDQLHDQVCTSGEGFARCFLRNNGQSDILPCLDLLNATAGRLSGECPLVSDDLAYYSIELFYIVIYTQFFATIFATWQEQLLAIAPTIARMKLSKGNTYNKSLLSLAILGELTMQPLDPKDVRRESIESYEIAEQRLMAWVVSQAIAVNPEFGLILCTSHYGPTETVKGGDINKSLTLISADAFDKILHAFSAVMDNPAAFLAFSDIVSQIPRWIGVFGLDTGHFGASLTAYLSSDGKKKTQLEQSLYSSSLCAHVGR